MNENLKIAALKLNTFDSANSAIKDASLAYNIKYFLVHWGYPLLGVIAFVAIVYAGMLFVTSGGDSSKVQKAKNALLYAVIGIMLVAAIGMIFALIGTSITDLSATGIPTETTTP